MTIQAINPATEAVLATYEEFTPEAVDAAVAAAHAAFVGWRLQPPVARAACLRAAAATLRARQSRYAALMTAEMGKPLAEAEAEIEKCAWACDYYAEQGPRFLAAEPVATN